MPIIAVGKSSFVFDQQGDGEGLSLQIPGDSTAALNEIGLDIARLLVTVDGLENVCTDSEFGDREVQITIDRALSDTGN